MMSSPTIEHFSHPKHPLRLKEDDVIGVDTTCSVCNRTILGSPTYTCTSDDTNCQNFYLHKSCAELPKEIIRDKLDEHPIALLRRINHSHCDVCRDFVKFSYACEDCDFDLCVACAFVSEQKVIHHEGHEEHKLILQRQASFRCDACWEVAKDYSYVCFTCDFWIHKKCALSPLIIPAPTYHHHPLNLVYCIPDMHRYFGRFCSICAQRVRVFSWSYYCHKCTFFVHMKCSTSTISLGNEIEENGIVDDDPDLVQFPLSGEESLFDLIITQCSKFQVEGDNIANISTISNDPNVIEAHWSHQDHPLELHEYIDDYNDIDKNDKDDDRRVLRCDGCVQPITLSHPCYYSCIQCGFFLHSFCATKLPQKLPEGASPVHPQHSLLLNRTNKFYSFIVCNICSYSTNGFYYECKTCDIKIDIRCTFLPTKIRHKSHKQHSFVQRPASKKVCRVSELQIFNNIDYACETCSSFQISINCAFYPRRMKHRYDDHSLILRYPPFFYEGVFYCQVCEEQLNNQWWLYHCDECDQSFHCDCLRSYINVKAGGTIKHSIGNQLHTLALVLKKTPRKNSPPYICGICEHRYKFQFFFECEGCGYLACIYCVREKNW